MTVGTTLNVAQFLTDGVVTEFPYSFLVYAADELEVILRDLDGDVVTTYAANEFSVSGLGENAGAVTIVPAPADEHEIVIRRLVPLTQDTDIVNQGGFFPEVIERQLDLIVMQNQQLNETLGRAIVSDLGDPSYTLGRLEDGDVIQLLDGKLVGISTTELAAPAAAAAAEAQGYAAALLTYTFGYISTDATPPAGVADGEGFVYTIDGRVYGALNNGGVADVQFELLTQALADTGGAGSGTVVSVAASGGTTGLSFTGGPITTTGTLTLEGTLAVAHGGTGAATAAGARTALEAAVSGANDDITSLRQSTAVTATGTPTASSIGFRGLPASPQSQGSGITLALDDKGKMVLNTLGGWLIPANASVAFPVGSTVLLYNDSASSQAVTITTDTLRQAGTANTGSRNVLQRGFATLVKVKPTEWVISGNIS